MSHQELDVPDSIKSELLSFIQLAITRGTPSHSDDLGIIPEPYSYPTPSRMFSMAEVPMDSLVGRIVHDGYDPNPQELAQLLSVAAKDVFAAYALGTIALGCTGRDRSQSEAYFWVSHCALRGVREAFRLLGQDMLSPAGLNDPGRAYPYLIQAALFGDMQACAMLGDFFLRGIFYEKNERVGYSWHLRGAESGSLYSMRKVIGCLEAGRGTACDHLELEKWRQRLAAKMS